MRRFGAHFRAQQRVLDIGCGYKPYQHFFDCEYLGLDASGNSAADQIGDAARLPWPNEHFDGVIMNQSLEHIADTTSAVAEVKRVLKPGGYALITVPQTMKNHSTAQPAAAAPVTNFDASQEPYWRIDYWRFTKFGLIYLWREFDVHWIKPSNGYASTLIQLLVYWLASFGFNLLLIPVYAILNTLGLVLDWLFHGIGIAFPKFKHFVDSTLTINYLMVVKKHD